MIFGGDSQMSRFSDSSSCTCLGLGSVIVYWFEFRFSDRFVHSSRRFQCTRVRRKLIRKAQSAVKGRYWLTGQAMVLASAGETRIMMTGDIWNSILLLLLQA